MALIMKLVEWRLESLIKEFDINMDNFSIGTQMREHKWLQLGEKIIPRDYVTTEKNIGRICILIIHNIIWKNIIKYDLIVNQWHSHMLYIDYKTCYALTTRNLYMTHTFLLKRMILPNMVRKNNQKIQNIIINYLMLIDPIITEFLIVDLSKIIKMYMLDAIIII